MDPKDVNTGPASGSIDQMKGILQRILRVTTPQGRIVIGELQCLDKQGNLVLGNAHEEVPKAEPRQMGIVLVPLQQQKNVEVQVRTCTDLMGMIELSVSDLAPASQLAGGAWRAIGTPEIVPMTLSSGYTTRFLKD